MTVIDLTLNEDTEDESWSNTLPTDSNGNEILITTKTQSMGSFSHRRPKELKFSSSNQDTWQPNQSECSFIFSSITTQNGHKIASKEQMKFATKYNGWMRQYRTYNGFRLFVRQNYTNAQTYAIKHHKPDKSFVQTTLMNWWNDMPEVEKNIFIRNANFMLTKRSEILQKNPKIKTVDSSNVPISLSLSKHLPKRNSAESTANEKKQLDDDCTTTESADKMQPDTTLHSPTL